jgi:hypothetical protein
VSAVILQHPRSRRFVAIVEGLDGWVVVPAIGDRVDARYEALAQRFEPLFKAQGYAAQLARHLGLEVEIRPQHADDSGAVA